MLMLYLLYIGNILLLLYTAFIGFPGRSYTPYYVVKFVTFFVAMISTITSGDLNKYLQYSLGIITVLFNPLFNFRLGRDAWQALDIIAAIILIIFSVMAYTDKGGEPQHKH